MDEFNALDELDIEIQDAEEIGSRLILLAAEVIWPRLTEPGERQEWFAWLNSNGILPQATDWELDLLESRATDAEEMSAAAAEAIVPLAWVAGLSDELPSRSTPEGVEGILELVPVPPERIEPFLDGLMPLDENIIALERERAEIWHWRISAEVSRRNASGIALAELTDAIREVVLEAAAALVIPDNDGSDLLHDGVAVRDLDGDLLSWMVFVTEERLRALNWTCGLTGWDQIDFDD